jgi:hypothetical protein
VYCESDIIVTMLRALAVSLADIEAVARWYGDPGRWCLVWGAISERTTQQSDDCLETFHIG